MWNVSSLDGLFKNNYARGGTIRLRSLLQTFTPKFMKLSPSLKQSRQPQKYFNTVGSRRTANQEEEVLEIQEKTDMIKEMYEVDEHILSELFKAYSHSVAF